MNPEGTTPQKSGIPSNNGLAPCKSANNAGAVGTPQNADEAGFSPAQHNGHEDNIAADFTLPLGEGIQENITVTCIPERAVMWAVPGSPGSRSESPPAQEGTAGGVTPGEPAEQGSDGGATVAGPGAAELAQPAWQFVTEANGDEAGIGNEAGIGLEGAFGSDGSGREAAAPERPAAHAKADRAPRYEVVMQARALMREIAQRRKKRQDTEPSAATVEKYKALAKVLLQRAVDMQVPEAMPAESPPLPSLCVAIAGYAANASTFYTMRSAAAWVVQRKVAALLTRQDRLQRTGGVTAEEGGSLMLAEWEQCVDALGAAAQLLRDVQGMDLQHALELSAAVPVASRSKRLVLKKAEEGWRDEYFRVTAQSRQYRHAALLQGLCGMRPLELERGVIVSRRGPMVSIKILGAKVRETAGQPWRGVFIEARKFPDWFLEDLGSGPKTYSAPRKAMRSYLGRLSPKVFPKQGDKPQLILSAYVLRHAIATDLRQAGWASEELAEVLGERCAATSRWYGLRWRGSKLRRSPEIGIERGTVQTARPVVKRESSFLASKKEGKVRKKQAKKPSNG